VTEKSRSAADASQNVEVKPETIQALFKKAWPKGKKHPDLCACAYVATTLNAVAGVKRLRRPGELGRLAGARKDLSEAKQASNKLLRNLSALRKRIEAGMWTLEGLGDDGPFHQANAKMAEQLAAIDQVHLTVEAMFAAIERPPTLADRSAVAIKEAAQEAWGRTNSEPSKSIFRPPTNGKAPRSVNPDDPLTLFVVAAFGEIGVNRSAADVSNDLRGMRGRQRKGRRKNPQ
jgi:hypothetical protein